MSTQPASPDDLPAYAFVPGGPWPHPTLSRPHGASKLPEQVPRIVNDDWRNSPSYLRGFRLLNAGYYWEAHEAWEGLWHAHGRRGSTADLVKALIRLAAAGVKVRSRQPRGVFIHGRDAADLFDRVSHALGRVKYLGLDMETCAALARQVAANPPLDPSPPGTRVAVVFSFEIWPG